jgi:phospholipid-binding lipoprotein MlaA
MKFFVSVIFCISLVFPGPAACGDAVRPMKGSGAGTDEERPLADVTPYPEAEEEIFEEFDDLLFEPEEEMIMISDPFEPFNRMAFTFNDRLYFLVLKPVAKGYSRVVPEKVRIGIRRFFSNVTTPIRFVNALLQFKAGKAGNELSRFLINTTVGVAGFMDPAMERWNISRQSEDVGQTLGFYGAGPGFYMNLPFFGPSSLRDSVGLVGDILLDPRTYVFSNDLILSAGVVAYDRGINETSLNIGVYEGIKQDALDPYIFVRDAYHQHRENLIRE